MMVKDITEIKNCVKTGNLAIPAISLASFKRAMGEHQRPAGLPLQGQRSS